MPLSQIRFSTSQSRLRLSVAGSFADQISPQRARYLLDVPDFSQNLVTFGGQISGRGCLGQIIWRNGPQISGPGPNQPQDICQTVPVTGTRYLVEDPGTDIWPVLGRVSGDCSGRYLASPTPDICRWTRGTDIWSAAERDICPTGPMENHPGYRVPERKPYRCAHPDNLIPDNQISGHCHVLPRGSASGPTRVAVFNSTSATTAAPSMQRAFPTHGASTTGFSFRLSLAHMGESTPPPAVLPVEAASAQLGFGFRTSSPLVREPNFTRRAVDVYGLKCMTFVGRSSNALGV